MAPNTPLPAPTVAQQHKHLRVAIQSLAFHLSFYARGIAPNPFEEERQAALEYLRTLAPDDGPVRTPPEVSGDGGAVSDERLADLIDNYFVEPASPGGPFMAFQNDCASALRELQRLRFASQLWDPWPAGDAAPVRERVQSAPSEEGCEVLVPVLVMGRVFRDLWSAECYGTAELVREFQHPHAPPSAQSEADARDARRYRWLREHRPVALLTTFFGNGCMNRCIEEVDAAIDAALSTASNAGKAGEK